MYKNRPDELILEYWKLLHVIRDEIDTIFQLQMSLDSSLLDLENAADEHKETQQTSRTTTLEEVKE